MSQLPTHVINPSPDYLLGYKGGQQVLVPIGADSTGGKVDSTRKPVVNTPTGLLDPATGRTVNAGGGGVNVARVSGLDTTGVKDMTPQVLSILEAEGHVYVPRGARVMIDQLIMPAGTTISGPGTVVYKTTTNQDDNTIRLLSDCTIDGPTFVADGLESIPRKILYTANCENPVIANCKFNGQLVANQSFVGFETWIYFDQNTTGHRCLNNTSRYGRYGTFSTAVSDGLYHGNRFFEPTTSLMQFYGGKTNTIIGNVLRGRGKHYSGDTKQEGDSSQGTVTGINFLSLGFLGSRRGALHNRIIGNHISGVTEEGIGFDAAANNVYNCPENYVLPVATVQDVNIDGQNVLITIQEPTLQGGSAAPAGWADEFFVVAMTGDAVGYTAKIISATSSASANTVTLRVNLNAGFPALSTGDKLLITLGFMFNEILGNTIAQTTTGISLYGSQWHNRAEGNIIRAITNSVQVGSVVSVLVPGAQASGLPAEGAGVQAYSGCCAVKDNTCVMDYEGQPVTYDRGNSNVAGPITAGTWCYGAPAVAAQNPGMDISGNTFVAARDAVLGGSFATTSPGNSTLTNPVITGNKSLGGGGLTLTRTAGAFVGPNFKNGVRENFSIGSSTLNTGVVNAA